MGYVVAHHQTARRHWAETTCGIGFLGVLQRSFFIYAVMLVEAGREKVESILRISGAGACWRRDGKSGIEPNVGSSLQLEPFARSIPRGGFNPTRVPVCNLNRPPRVLPNISFRLQTGTRKRGSRRRTSLSGALPRGEQAADIA